MLVAAMLAITDLDSNNEFNLLLTLIYLKNNHDNSHEYNHDFLHKIKF
ncbi:hypothetical protein NIES2107_72140 (plasmid) [Nostoc carneum NIES-2107]|nr:hypothetical protein NIES2107_72140 [Nostoc carneum NIES-2107]